VIHPYKELFISWNGQLALLDFKCVYDAEYATIYERPDAYRLSVTIERSNHCFSVATGRALSGADTHLDPSPLMLPLSPDPTRRLLIALRAHGYTVQTIDDWWKEFLGVLHRHKIPRLDSSAARGKQWPALPRLR
jgi:hypothetical protein